MNKKINIAIDGYSSCGKGTLAKHMARELNYIFIDSGAMYRAVTLYFLRNGIDLNNSEQIEEALKNIDIHFNYNPHTEFYESYLNGVNVEKDIRTMEIANSVSAVSAIPQVRRFLVNQQQKIGKNKGVVMDGRDIGTVVFPDAELKIFMTASSDIRAQRRFNELQNSGSNVTYDEVLENLQKRDHMDSTRADSPLKMAEDARVLDNSNISKEDQAKVALAWVKEILNGSTANR
jgi:CMP/dCMP kinase